MTTSRRPSLLTIVAASLAGALPLVLLAAPGVFQAGTQPSDGLGDPAYPPFEDGPGVPGALDRVSTCAGCHAAYRAPGEPIHEPHDTWAGSMMAMAARDPLFWAAVDIANQDDALEFGDIGIGDYCLRCHLPQGWLEGRARCATPWGEEFDGSCFSGDKTTPDSDWEGITCHYCHRMYDASQPDPGDFADPAAPHLQDGRVYLSTDRTTMRGPFSDPQVSGYHSSVGSELHRSSAFCGQCHDVTNPVLNRLSLDGTDLGYPMPIDTTWTEWLLSDFADEASSVAATCQDCHMPLPDLDGDGLADPAYAAVGAPLPRGPGSALEGGVRSHAFVGPSTWMLGLLRDEYGAALGRTESIDANIAAGLRLLQERTATLELFLPASYRPGEAFDADFRVTNLAGHKFPSGYPEGRRAWVNLEWGEDFDGDGELDPDEVAWESHEYDEASGSLRDPNGLARLLQVYEAKYGIWDLNDGDLIRECDVKDDGGLPIFHNVLANCIVKDSRLPPQGFRSQAGVEPVLYTYPENPAAPGTLVHWDDDGYIVRPEPWSTAPLAFRATLYYQSASAELFGFLQRANLSTCDPTDPGCDPTQPDARMNRGEKMFDLWTRNGRCAPVVVATATGLVDIAPEPLPGETGAQDQSLSPMIVSAYDSASGRLTVTFGNGCDVVDQGVAWGPLGSVSTYGYLTMACGYGNLGFASFTPGPGSQFFVATGRNSQYQSSVGRDSFGAERPEPTGLGPCDRPQLLGGSCP